MPWNKPTDTPRTNLHDDYYRQITVACHILNVSAFIQVECFTASRAFSDLPIRHTASKPADSLCASILSSKSMLPGICKIHWNLKYYTHKNHPNHRIFGTATEPRVSHCVSWRVSTRQRSSRPLCLCRKLSVGLLPPGFSIGLTLQEKNPNICKANSPT